jgi:hypothetical protein
MPTRVLILALAWVLATEGAARAQDAEPEPPTRKEIALGVVRGVRRSIALGPTFGAFAAYAPSPSDFDAGISFGLELELFQTRLPTPERLQELAKEKAKAKLLQIIRDRFGGQRPDAATMKELVRQIAAEIKAEVIAGILAEPPVLERPRLAIPLEANYMFSSGDWLARAGFAIGIGPVSIGPSFSVRFGDQTVARLGGELSIHLLPTPSPRSPVLDIFLRGDFELHKRDTNDDQIVLGARVLLDLI